MGIVGDVVSGLFGSSKSKKAAKAVTEAADKNNALSLDIYNQNKGNLAPYMANGPKAGGTINDFLGLNGTTAQTGAKNMFGTYKDAAGYNFNLDQQNDALNSSNASKGLLKSGSSLKALTKYQTGLADSYAQNWLGDLQGQQATGLSAANALAGVGSAFVNQTTNNNNNAAGAKADNAINQANLFSNVLGNIDKRASQFIGFGSSYGG
jgi:hypothetical protein